METVTTALATGAAAALGVSLWTFRLALTARGRRLAGSVLAGFEAVLFVVIFTGLIANLGDPIRIAAYAGGVAVGTWLGLAADERLSSGQSEVRLILAGDGAELIDRLLSAGWPATWTAGVGLTGPTTTVTVAVDDRRRNDLLALIDTFRPAPFVTVERLRHVRPVPLPTGFVQVGSPRRRTLVRRGGR